MHSKKSDQSNKKNRQLIENTALSVLSGSLLKELFKSKHAIRIKWIITFYNSNLLDKEGFVCICVCTDSVQTAKLQNGFN